MYLNKNENISEKLVWNYTIYLLSVYGQPARHEFMTLTSNFIVTVNKQSNKYKRGNQNEKQEKKPKNKNPRSYNAVNADCLYSRNGWLLVSFWILRKRGSQKCILLKH